MPGFYPFHCPPPENKLQRDLYHNNDFKTNDAFENLVWSMAAILRNTKLYHLQ